MTGTSPTTAAPVRPLTFDATVPRQIAHRRAVGEVFVTDSVQLDGGDVLLALQLPRGHSLWFDRDVPWHDTFSIAEAARQASFVVVHRHLGVPVGLPFTLQNFAFRVPEVTAYADDSTTPLEGVLRYRVVEERRRGADFSELTLRGDVTVNGVPAMSLTADMVFMDPEDYKALRSFQLARRPAATDPVPVTALAPEQVGRRDPRNVVIGDRPGNGVDENVFLYAIDRSHPSFFDHDYDHVPGPFIVEGFRQAAVVACHRSGLLPSPRAAVMGCSTLFTGFGEFGAPLECAVGRPRRGSGGRIVVEVALRQYGTRAATGQIELAALSS